MRELVRGYAAACFESAVQHGHLANVSFDLVTLARVLTTSDALRQVVTDSVVEVQLRRDVVHDLLVDKATEEATELAMFIVRVEQPSEIPATVAALALLSEDTNADPARVLHDVEPPAGRGEVRERIRGFAERVFQEISLQDIDEVEDELFRIARLLDDYPELRRTMQDTNAPFAGREAVLADVLSAQARPATLRLATYVFRAGRLRDIVGTFEWLVELAAKERGRRVAEVRIAVELDEAERSRLATALGRLVDRTVEVRTVLDASVIGGVLISVGDLVIDGTVRLRFERLRDLLASSR